MRGKLLAVLTLLFMLSLVGCSKKEPVTSTEDFGVIEESSVQETTKDAFAVEDPNIAGYEIRESTAVSHETEETREITFNVPTEETAEGVLTEEESSAFEVMGESFTHPITGEFFNRNELNNIYNMQYEAQTLWKSEFDAGRVSKEVVTQYFNYVYEAVDDAAREKTIQEILSPNLKVTFIEPESWPLEEEVVTEEVLSEEEIQAEVDKVQNIIEGYSNSENLAEQRYAELLNNGANNTKTAVDELITDPSRVTTGDLSPYNPD